MRLENKQVLLIGASGGIGQAIAKALDKTGAKLMLVGRNAEKLKQLEQGLNGEHQIIIADINNTQGRDAIVEQCEKSPLKIVINASGILDFQLYEQQDSDMIANIMATNLVSPMLLCQRLIPLLQQRQEAVILNIGSIFGSIGHPGFTTYCASKFGLRGFTEALQRELADSHIRVSYLAPRATQTDLNSSKVTALNKALSNATDSPEQVAQEVMNLLAGKQSQRFMGWPEKLFVRINGLFPGIVHNALVKKLPLIRQYAQR